MSVNMMSAMAVEPGLSDRLVRLRGEAPSCDCVPEYEKDAERIRRSPSFPARLGQIRALADEHRLVAVALLKRRGELCACEIQAATGLTHATVSHHMGVLVDARLVRSRREGKWIYYRLAGPTEVRIP